VAYVGNENEPGEQEIVEGLLSCIKFDTERKMIIITPDMEVFTEFLSKAELSLSNMSTRHIGSKEDA